MTKNNKGKTKIKSLLTILAIIAVAIAGAGWMLYNSGFDTTEKKCVYIDTDDNIDSVKTKIYAAAPPKYSIAFDLFSNAMNLKDKIHTGMYEITPDISVFDYLRHIKNHIGSPVNFVVPTARTTNDLAGKLAKRVMADSVAIADYLNDNEKIAALGFTKETLPAMFIPNTYDVFWDASVDDIMQRMKKEYDKFWNADRTAKLKEVSKYAGREMTPIDVATLASIVESETANDGEKPAVAGLYLNRLRTNMKLQSDPTVIFACQDFTIRRVLNTHLQTPSPYNTYLNFGLPPGPIRIPSIAGLDAVLNHDHNNYIYMCAKEDFSGTHNFAANYDEHLANARRYTKALDERGIKK